MLFTPYSLRGLTLRNRIAVSPMCEYSYRDGFSNDWQLVHLGSRAVGGAGLVIAEATAVEDRGRISPGDLGIWKDEHVEPLLRVARFIREQGAAAGIQLAHAGRKASTDIPWVSNKPLTLDKGGWKVVGPSSIPFDEGFQVPQELSKDEIQSIVSAFSKAAQRSLNAGFQVVEIHAAHGYLLHEFLSPLSNQRKDEYGGSFENRIRVVLEVVRAVRKVWPETLPLFIRISSVDWAEGGWDIQQSVELCKLLKKEGVDLVDCSSGGLVPGVSIPVGPGYQTSFAERIRRESSIPTGAVGVITSSAQADHILRTHQADLVLLARQLLRDPYWPLHAASELKAEGPWPHQYLRSKG